MKQTIYYLMLPVLTIVILTAAACGGADVDPSTVMTVKRSNFELVIPAFGELEAVKSTPIAIPPHVRGSQTIAWIAPESSPVKKGDIVIRFDETTYKEQLQRENYDIKKLDLDIRKMEKELQLEKKELQKEIDITAIEKEMAQIYGAKDTTIYSKNEIIDASIDLDLLKTKVKHYKDKKKQLEQKAKTELQLLELRKRTHLVKINQYNEALQFLEIKAPHDGLFIYQKNWRGEKPRVGKSLYSGEKLGKLPDLSNMKAKIYVLESEAAGLKKELPVTITLDSMPGRSFNGKIIGIDTIAKPIDMEGVLKYFEVQVGLDDTDSSVMRPGNQLKASVFVHRKENVITVPNQAVFMEKEKYYVMAVKNGDTEKREVTVDTRSLTRTIIEKGLEEGETILLSGGDGKDKNGAAK